MKPIQYQKGFVEWYKLKLKVTPDVLIPRPETELLVDEVLKQINNYQLGIKNEKQDKNKLLTVNSSLLILDIGTGSGNIAIALAKNLTTSKNIAIIAADISEKALKVARQNAKLHGVLDKIEFTQSNLLSSINSQLLIHNSKLIIVTNLPYIPSSRIPTLDPSVKDFEPYIALDGGENGFNLYEKLFNQIKKMGLGLDLLVAEIDHTHQDLSVSIAKKYFPDMVVEVKKDLTKTPRILSIRKKLF